MEYIDFIKAVEEGTLPRKEFNHIAHLRLALYYLFAEKDLYKALSKTRCRIIIYNEVTLKQTLLSPIYSETITQFWVRELFKLIKQNEKASLAELERFLLASELVKFDYIYGFYTKEFLEFDFSKAIFCRPNVKEF